MPNNTPFQIDESVGGRWLIVSPETRPTPWGGLIQCHTHADAEAKRDALNAVVRRVTDPRDAEIARLTAEVERLRDEADRACKRSQFHKDNHLAAEAEVERLRARCGSYERALKAIASEDYRGNRPPSAIEAERALKEPTDAQQ